jgi:hypothetical protein
MSKLKTTTQPCKNDPTNLDLHREQARQGVLLNGLSQDIRDIKHVIIGNDRASGLVLEVDRLKQSSRTSRAFAWVVFTAGVGVTTTLIASYLL